MAITRIVLDFPLTGAAPEPVYIGQDRAESERIVRDVPATSRFRELHQLSQPYMRKYHVAPVEQEAQTEDFKTEDGRPEKPPADAAPSDPVETQPDLPVAAEPAPEPEPETAPDADPIPASLTGKLPSLAPRSRR